MKPAIRKAVVAALGILVITVTSGCIDSFTGTERTSFGTNPTDDVKNSTSIALIVKDDEVGRASLALLKEGLQEAVEKISKEVSDSNGKVVGSPVRQSGRSLQVHIASSWPNLVQYLGYTSWILRPEETGDQWTLLSHASFHTFTMDEPEEMDLFGNAELSITLTIDAPGTITECNGEQPTETACVWQDSQGRDLSLTFVNESLVEDEIITAQMVRLLKQLRSDSDNPSERKDHADQRKQAAYGLKLLGVSNNAIITALKNAFDIETDEDAKYAMSQALRRLL
jgi:hypothetical protein